MSVLLPPSPEEPDLGAECGTHLTSSRAAADAVIGMGSWTEWPVTMRMGTVRRTVRGPVTRLCGKRTLSLVTRRSSGACRSDWQPLTGASFVREGDDDPPVVQGAAVPRAAPAAKLSDRARAAMRLRHFSPRTEEAYLGWMRRYHEFHGRRDPARLGPEQVTAFLNSLATERRVSAATQNQALAALLFLYRGVLGVELPWLENLVHARTSERLPVVLTRSEVRAILGRMEGEPRLMATLLYGCGLRLLECCRLRVKDIDFSRNQITVRSGKGAKDRATMLPVSIQSELTAHLERVRTQHQRDQAEHLGWVELPGALAKKLPSAGREWPWQWVFPATRHYVDRESGQKRRHHLHETVVQHAVRRAVLASGISKRATCHTFRHSFATHRSKMAATSEPCRSCSVTITSPPR